VTPAEHVDRFLAGPADRSQRQRLEEMAQAICDEQRTHLAAQERELAKAQRERDAYRRVAAGAIERSMDRMRRIRAALVGRAEMNATSAAMHKHGDLLVGYGAAACASAYRIAVGIIDEELQRATDEKPAEDWITGADR